MMPRAGLVVVLLTLAAGLARAQDATARWPGLATSELSTVYVLDDAGVETSGKLVRLDPDSIVLLVGGSERRFDAARVRRVQKRGDSIRNGAIIGAVVGAVFGALGSGFSDCPGDNPGGNCAGSRVALFALSTGIYTAMGAGIDALIVGRTTLYTAQVRPARGATGRPAVTLSVRVPLGRTPRHGNAVARETLH